MWTGCKAHSYPHCHGWGSCSKSCGGGSRGRICESCFIRHKKWFYEDCNQHCYNGGSFYSGYCHCSSWRSGDCCERCYPKYIAHCKSGYKECGGSPDNIRCTKCEDGYYGAGYGNGCKECSRISQCKRRRCTSYYNTECIECYDNRIFYKPSYGGSQCERKLFDISYR
ncbi:integrin beta-7-like [Ruditapes philippinarum]|uniref:integrin beta-7-like n=1 Tax=Ruditapes philippinarum TaxID=129788 RepID=UPI00295C11F4|nr:integrin beta-7-like [Ruditapes philippinarum]